MGGFDQTCCRANAAPAHFRAFLALELPADIRRKLADLQTVYKKQISGRISWVPPQKMHMTLVFLGMIEQAFWMHEVVPRMEQALQYLSPFDLDVAGVGFFGSPRCPRVIWAGTKNCSQQVRRLQHCLIPYVEQAGVQIEKRPFFPHVTLGRIRSLDRPAALTAACANDKNRPFGICSVTHVALIKSVLMKNGSQYTRLIEMPMEGD